MWGGVPASNCIWRGKEKLPKTPNALREVDIAPPLAQLLQEHTAAKSGYLFVSAVGTPLIQRNVLHRLHDTKTVGLHAFRRFRAEVLRRARVPEDLIQLWLGHSKQSVTDFYADGLKKDSVLAVILHRFDVVSMRRFANRRSSRVPPQARKRHSV